MKTKTAPGLKEIQEAQARLDGIARVTPVYTTETLSKIIGREVSLKAENLQRTGSFKIRGAVNKIATLSEAATRAAAAVSNVTVVPPRTASCRDSIRRDPYDVVAARKSQDK